MALNSRPRVCLEPINDEDFAEWLKAGIVDYAADKVRAGNWPAEDALKLSAESYNEQLADGPRTEGNSIFSILDDDSGNKVGMIWVNTAFEASPGSAFIYDFIIFPEYRRLSFGESALCALECKLAEMGIRTLSLHVFGYNQPAIALYQKVGFKATNINMSKQIGR